MYFCSSVNRPFCLSLSDWMSVSGSVCHTLSYCYPCLLQPVEDNLMLTANSKQSMRLTVSFNTDPKFSFLSTSCMATRTELLCDVGQHGWLITEVIAQEVGITIMNSAPIVNGKICSKDLINIVHNIRFLNESWLIFITPNPFSYLCCAENLPLFYMVKLHKIIFHIY